MSLTNLIDDLAENSESLRAAMQSGDAARIEEATEAFRNALERVKAIGAAPAEPGLREKLAALQPQLEEARALSCLLADMTGQMHDLVAAKAMDVRQPLYSRAGERFA